jgi:dihydropteroate synthase
MALVMGVLNVTPDSFFDGGQHATTETAVARGLAMADEGADIIDVGGESSRPGAVPVSIDIELARVVPVVEALAAALDGRARLSVDTVKPEVAAAALAAGASLVNDISASVELMEVARAHGAGWVAMHMLGTPGTMQDDPHYGDVVAEVARFVLSRAATALSAGLGEVWVDPGIGFGKTVADNLSLLRHVPELVATASAAGCTGVMVGTSRKRFLGVLAGSQAEPAGPEERAEGSLATAAAAMVAGAGMLRVHDVAATVQAARLYGPAA